MEDGQLGLFVVEAGDEGGGLDVHGGGSGGEERLGEFSIANRLAEEAEAVSDFFRAWVMGW